MKRIIEEGLLFTGLATMGIFSLCYNFLKYYFLLFRAENAALFCIAWGYNINDLDNEILMTPLLLAVNCGSLKIT